MHWQRYKKRTRACLLYLVASWVCELPSGNITPEKCGFTQREAEVLNNVSLPFLNPLEQGKETALHVSKRFGIALTLALPT